MLRIQVAGPGCRNCRELAGRVKQALEELHISSTVEELTDFKSMAEAGVLMTPGLIVNGKVLSQGKVPTASTIRDWLTSASQS